MILQCSKILWGVGITLCIGVTGYIFMREKLPWRPIQQDQWIHVLMRKSSLKAVKFEK